MAEGEKGSAALRRLSCSETLGCGAVFLVAAWALAAALDLGTRIVEVGFFQLTAGSLRGTLAFRDVYLVAAVLLGAVAGCTRQTPPTGGRP